MKKTLRKRSKSPIAKVKAKAWKAFSLWIRKRDNWTCFTCGKRLKNSPTLHAGHFISRRHNATLFDERNVHAQCMYCNMWDYGNMGVYVDNLIKLYGVGIIEELRKKSRESKQFTVKELEEIEQEYRGKLKDL